MVGHMNNLTKKKYKIVNGKKTIQVIKQLVSWHPNQNAFVLDSLQDLEVLVMQTRFNKKDEGNRVYICTIMRIIF
jgi:hypothetical protein